MPVTLTFPCHLPAGSKKGSGTEEMLRLSGWNARLEGTDVWIFELKLEAGFKTGMFDLL